ncbi:hypothetical protein LguiB_017267 [Lonicera macranthoides]
MDPTELIELDLDDNLVAANQLGKFHSVGKILSEKILTKAAIIKIAKSSWNTEEFFSMAAWGDNIFVFNFELESDCSKIFEASPWAFMGFMMSLKRWDPSKTISEIDFNRCLFYVQIHDLLILKSRLGNGGLSQLENLATGAKDIVSPLSKPFPKAEVILQCNNNEEEKPFVAKALESVHQTVEGSDTETNLSPNSIIESSTWVLDSSVAIIFSELLIRKRKLEEDCGARGKSKYSKGIGRLQTVLRLKDFAYVDPIDEELNFLALFTHASIDPEDRKAMWSHFENMEKIIGFGIFRIPRNSVIGRLQNARLNHPRIEYLRSPSTLNFVASLVRGLLAKLLSAFSSNHISYLAPISNQYDVSPLQVIKNADFIIFCNGAFELKLKRSVAASVLLNNSFSIIDRVAKEVVVSSPIVF